MRFAQSFWPVDHQFRSNLIQLSHRLDRSLSENNQILQFVSNRISIEALYGKSLTDLAGIKRSGSQPLNLGSEEEEGASLGRAFDAVKESYLMVGSYHIQLSDDIKTTVLLPLTRICDEYKQVYMQASSKMKSKILAFEKSLNEVNNAKIYYEEKCRLADLTEGEALEVAGQEDDGTALTLKPKPTYLMGKLTLSEPDLRGLLRKLQTNTNNSSQMFKGFFGNLNSGESLVRELLSIYPNQLRTPAEAVLVGQALIDQGFLRLIGPGQIFHCTASSFYQWKKNYEFQSEGVPDHVQARSLATQADDEYKSLVQKADVLRTEVEEQFFLYLTIMERNETSRIESIKAAFVSLASLECTSSAPASKVGDTLFPHLETLKPEQDVALIVEHCRTSPFRPKPVLYHNYYFGPGLDQVFGVSIDEQAKSCKSTVPTIMEAMVELLVKAEESSTKQEIIDMWCAHVALDSSHKLRRDLNQGEFKPELLTNSQPNLIASTFRLYLLELPDGLVPTAQYEPFRSIEAIVEDEDRNEKIKQQLMELSISEYLSLKLLIRSLANAIDGLNIDDPLVHKLLKTYSRCILRPKESSASSGFHDRHPYRLLKDLIQNFTKVFIDTPEESKQKSPIQNIIKQDSLIDLTEPARPKPDQISPSLELTGLNVTKPTDEDDFLDLDLELELGDMAISSDQDIKMDLELNDHFFDD